MLKLYVGFGIILVLSLVINSFGICGGVCIVNIKKNLDPSENIDQVYCWDLLLISFISDSCLKMLLGLT